jgi:glycosyltransferase involved in cell wall biosynthesis
VLGWKPQFNDPRVASVRLRCLNPLFELQRRHFPVELFTEENLEKYVAVIFSKSHDLKSYEIAVELKRKGKAVIFDICDNHFYNPYDLERFKLVRSRLLNMLALADLVVTSTETLAAVITEEGKLTTRPAVVGDAVETLDLMMPKNWVKSALVNRKWQKFVENAKPTILWYGIHGGENAPYGMLDLLNIKEILVRLSEHYSFRLVIVSNSRKKYRRYIRPLPIETVYWQWGDIPFRRILRQCDINIIPINKNPFTLCKSNNRLALALYEGVPTVADEIPSYRELAPFCVLNDWEDGLRLYLSNNAIAKECVMRAKPYIEERFTIKHVGDQWARTLANFL